MRKPSRSLGSVAAVLVSLAFSVSARADNPPSAPDAATARLTLAQAIQRALAQNINMVVALEEVHRAEGLLKEARSGSLPTLTGTGVYTRLDADRTFGGRTILAQDQISANLLLTVPIIAPQRWATWSHASSNVKAVRASSEDVRRQTAVAVARAFLAVIAQRHVLDVDRHALVTAKAHYDYAHTRLLGGIGNRVDDVRAEQQVATNQAQLDTSEVAWMRAKEALGIVVGDQGPIDAVEDIPLAAPPSLETAMVESTTTRPDIVASRTKVELADQVKKDNYTDYLPFLIGNVQPFYQHPESLTQPSTGWQAQLVLTLPLYDGGLRYGLADERESLSVEARSQYDAMVRMARSDVRVAFETVKRAEAVLASSANAARLAHAALDLATIAYRAGATTNLEVIDAERAAHAADTAAAVAEDQASQARIDLLAASGRFP